MDSPTAVVIGQLARDLVLDVDESPAAGTAADAHDRREQLGGKGANQAVALAQLGVRPVLVAVAGDDPAGDALLAQARRDGIDVSRVIRRGDTATGLIVEILDGGGDWRYVQHLPRPVLLTEDDVRAAESALTSADAVVVQLQQPPEAVLAATRIAVRAGRLIILDGVPPDGPRAELLHKCDVLRADAQEAELLLGVPPDDPDRVRAAATELLTEGPSLIAVAVDGGNLFVWRDGHLLLPLRDSHVADTTGGGDSFVAALTAALVHGHGYRDAAVHAVAAAGITVTHPGGRPDLGGTALKDSIAALEKQLADG